MDHSEGIVVEALLWWQNLPIAEGRIVEIRLNYSARAVLHKCLEVIHSLELSIISLAHGHNSGQIPTPVHISNEV